MASHGNRVGEAGAEARESKADISVAFLPCPDFTLLPLAGFVDAMRHAADEGDRSRQIHCRWTYLSATKKPIRASCGIKIRPWGRFEDPDRYDYLVVVGGLLSSMHRLAPKMYDFIRQGAEAGKSIIGLCTGSFVMAEAGLMKGRQCAVHIHHQKDFIERYPDSVPVVNEIYVKDGPFYTCPGGAAAIDLAVEILCERCGRSRGMKGLTALVVDEHRKAEHIARMPDRDFENCGDRRVEQAVHLMRHNLGTSMRIGELADEMGTTVVQLERAFKKHTKKTPLVVWRDMRLQQARWCLLNSTRTVSEIAYECGFSDNSHLSRWFKREYGMPPQQYRQMRAAEVRQG